MQPPATRVEEIYLSIKKVLPASGSVVGLR